MSEPIHFLVEQAGCESCAQRVRSALADVLTIDEISVDEAADLAAVRAQAPPTLTPAAVDAALAGRREPSQTEVCSTFPAEPRA